MIELPRREAGRFRALARRCVVGRPRGPAPPVILRQDQNCLTLSTSLGEVTLSLRLSVPTAVECESIVPSAVLEAVEGNDSGSATIDVASSGKIRCRWTNRGESREASFDAPASAAMPMAESPPSRARRMRSVDESFLSALHECGRTTSGESVRYAFSRVQLRGKEGQVIATDGRQLLVCSGFEFPFEENVLIPAVPVFGNREITAQPSVRVGSVGSEIIVEVGPWTVGLTIDRNARFPDVATVLARSTGGASLRLAAADAETLVRGFERCLDRTDKTQSLVVRISPEPEIVIAGNRISLAQSEFAGDEKTIAVQAQNLVRALQMGLRTLHANALGGTVLFADERRSYLVTCPHPDSTSPADASRPIVTSSESRIAPEEGGQVMPPVKNVLPSTDGDGSEDALDPLVEAEGLRVALGEAGRRATRLVASLRQLHKQRRVFQTAWTSLKQLGLGGREES
jgi:hypothetical protein